MFRISGLNPSQIQGMLEEDYPDTAVDVFWEPPLSSDEDSEDEEEVAPKDLNHLGRNTLAQDAVLQFPGSDDEAENEQVFL